MKRLSYLLSLLLLLFLTNSIHALSVIVVEPPVLEGILSDDLSSLWYDSLISFERLENADKDMSVSEMLVQAQKINADFIVYGFSEQDEMKYSVELRLIDTQTRKTEKFFYAADSLDSTNRLSQTLAKHIHDYLCDKFSIRQSEFIHRYKFDITLSGGYWTYTNKEWTDLLLGIACAHLGFEFHPALDFQFRKTQSIDFSIALNGGYRYCRGRDESYGINFHAMEYAMPIMVNWNPTENHSLKFGAGPIFQYAFVEWTPLYEDEEVKNIYQWGVTSFLQGRVFLSKYIGLLIGVGGSWYPVEHNVPEFSAELGFVITPINKGASR